MVTPELVAFGRCLRQLRETAALSQRQLGSRLGYDHTFICKIESGTRWPPKVFVERADELLRANGELSSRWPALVAGRALRRHGTTYLPLQPDAVPRPIPGDRLPILGVVCPIHGFSGCAATVSGTWVVHDFTVLLAGFTRSYLETADTSMVGDVESCLRLIIRMEPTTSTLHLAAQYAHLAGWLRVEQGQRGLGMLWFQHGVEWGSRSGNIVSACECLSRMSLVARLEGDARCATDYAAAVSATGSGLTWAAALAEVYLLRGFGIGGDWDALRSHARTAITLFDRCGGANDRIEVPWMCDERGQSFLESSVSASLRDISALRGDTGMAKMAVSAAEVALDTVARRLRPTQVLLTLRLADAHACAGRPDAAVATAETVLSEVLSTRTTLIKEELLGLRRRLIRSWGELGEVRDFDERLRMESLSW